MSPPPTVRQAIGAFHDTTALEDAVSDLQSHGFDRAEISFVSSVSEPGDGPASGTSAGQAKAGVSNTDLRQGRILGTSLVATLAGFAAAGFAVATGGTAVAAIAVAVAAAGGAGVASELVGKAVASTTDSFDDAGLSGGSVLVLVHVRDRAAETRAMGVLRRHSVDDVHVTELPVTRLRE